MSGRTLRNWAEYLAFRLIACGLQLLSARQTARMAEGLAWVFVRVLPRRLTRYDVAYENITRAFGVPEHGPARAAECAPPTLSGCPVPRTPHEVDELIRRMWVHLFRLVAEVVQLPRVMTLTNCREVIVFRNRRVVLEAICTGRPVIVLGGHFGNWEVSTATFGLFGMPMGIVGRALDNPLLNAWFEAAREATGHRLIVKRGAADEMVALLAAGGNLGLLCDQDAGRKGLFVDFFGRPASTFKSIALMAIEYRAILIVGYGLRLPDDFLRSRWARFEIGCEEVIDTAEYSGVDGMVEVTRRYTAALERAVRRAPDQYFWVHRRWKTLPRGQGAADVERPEDAAANPQKKAG
jgi:KDO2-lipid IV(A) lauroyltransferase